MGIELVMRVEDEFDFSIPDEHYERFRTVGDLCSYIDQRKQAKQLCLNPAAFVRIRRALMARFGLQRRQIRTTTDLLGLFPVEHRRRQWTAFEKELGLSVPRLEHSRSQKEQAAGMLVGLVVAPALLSFLHPSFLIVSLLTLVVALAAAVLIEERLATTFPDRAATVGALTQSVAVLNPFQLSNEIGQAKLSDDRNWPRLRRVVSESLGIPEEEIFPHSRFIEDLLVG